MHVYILATIIFFFAPITHAACVQNPEDGTYYDNVTLTSCTPSATVTQPELKNKTTGGPELTNPKGQNIKLINPLNTGECAPNENCLLNFLNKILDFVIRIGTVVV
ncbi:MAG: hypothetical protein AAB555_02835, partial [Patescibacteria group bacterium]